MAEYECTGLNDLDFDFFEATFCSTNYAPNTSKTCSTGTCDVVVEQDCIYIISCQFLIWLGYD